MSTEAPEIEVNTQQMTNPTEGASDRFTARMANQPAEVREASPENENNNAVPAKKEPEQKKEEAPEKKSGIPDFGKKAETPKDEDADKKALEEELKQHPAIKGEAAKSFAKIRDQRIAAEKALQAKTLEFEARIKELEAKGSGVPSKEQQEAFERANARLKELEEELGKANYERTPRFKQFSAAEKQELEAAKSYLDGDEHQQSVIETASRLKGQARLKALVDSGMNSETIAVVASNLARVDAIRRERDGELENWRSRQSEYEQQSKTQQEQRNQQQSAEEKKVFDAIFSDLTPKLTAYQKVDGYDEWNTGVDQRISEANRHFSGKSSLEEISAIITKGVGYDALDKVNASLQSKVDQLTDELSKLKSATPGGGSPTTRQNADDSGTAASRFDQRMGR